MTQLLYRATLDCRDAVQGRDVSRVLVRLADEHDLVALELDPRAYLVSNHDLPPFVPGKRYSVEIREL